jgi:hypothetical protein
MQNLCQKEENPCLDKICALRASESMLRPSSAAPRIEISSHYRYSSISELSPALMQNLAPLIAATQAEGFLLPRQEAASALSLVPAHGALSKLFELAADGVALSTAASIISTPDILRLCTLGMLAVRLSSGSLSGPAAQLLLAEKESKVLPPPRRTDPMSEAAIRHAVRLPIMDILSLTERLYSYNSEPVFHSGLLAHTESEVKQLVGAAFSDTSTPRPAPSDNPGWHMFYPVNPSEDRAETAQHYKLYISPVVQDLPRCLSRLATILPRLRFQAWKVGRFTYGISRPDKICLYFGSLTDAQSAAQVLSGEMQEIRQQGVPFTERQDNVGLISLAMDPPRQTARSVFSTQNSWRLWVSRKIATAVILAKQSPDYPLSPEQSALWTMQFLGVEPETWRIHNSNFWRN